MNFRKLEELEDVECTCCRKKISEGYSVIEATDLQYELLDRILPYESWLICKTCCGKFCEDANAWMRNVFVKKFVKR